MKHLASFLASFLAGALVGSAVDASAQIEATDQITTIRGERITGEIEGLDVGPALLLRGVDRSLPLDDVAEIIPGGVKETAPELGGGSIHLRSGVALPASFVRGDDTSIVVDVPWSRTPIAFAMRHLQAVRLREAIDGYDGFEKALHNPSSTRDFLFAIHPETGKVTRLSVRVVRFEDGRLAVETRHGTETIPVERLHAIVFGTDNGLRPDPQPKPRVRVELQGGTADAAMRIDGTLAGWNDNAIEVRLDEGAVLELAPATIRRIAVRSGRLAILSDLDPEKVQQTPAFDRVRPWLRDATPLGDGIELGGKSYRRGLCLLPRTELSYRLEPGEFDVFEAVLGIDDRAPAHANAEFRVRLDGDVAFSSAQVTRGQEPRVVRLELGDARRLTLETDFGENFDLGDHCVFAEARLVKNRR